ncbi:DUF6059 family protein [Streptacidiphilus sp. N1-10]|uniref:DUF6059 family protein n=1 Tax=Streptacidiphilus jeojiensis TaxID=3229225 RepID=A0ABV6XH35_9ACTN
MTDDRRRRARRPPRWWWLLLLDRWTPGLIAFGCSLWGICTPWPWPEARQRTGPADHPPPGHPERLCVHIPPTEVERDLWSRLGLPT